MSTARPVVSVFNHETGNVSSQVRYPFVLCAPIRLDLVNFVHTNMAKNSRQAHGVDKRAGMKHSAHSWGTGRAVARIPRVSGSGTNRSGQGAFGNQTRKGRMAHPLKTWRRWHRKINIKQRRHALASALAATAIPALVMARGHRVQNVPQLPLVLGDEVGKIQKTKQAIEVLRRFGAYDDVLRVSAAKTLRAGRGKLRNRRYKLRKGPLLIVGGEGQNLRKAIRNIPGVEIANVNRLNLLRLAPGGHIGRFVIWTQSAFEALNKHFGSFRQSAELKGGYRIQKEVLTNSDVARIINSDEIQRVLRPTRQNVRLHLSQRKNPLRNRSQYRKLNPYAVERVQKTQAITKAKARPPRTEDEKMAAQRRVAARKVLKSFQSDVTAHADQTIKEYGNIMQYSTYM